MATLQKAVATLQPTSMSNKRREKSGRYHRASRQKERFQKAIRKMIKLLAKIAHTSFPSRLELVRQYWNKSLGCFAEFERSINRERQREGIEIAKRKGKKFGRGRAIPPAKEEDIRKLKEQGVSSRAIGAAMGCSHSVTNTPSAKQLTFPLANRLTKCVPVRSSA